ncbi:hypothetical protein CS022_01595 [Veronia nyctiphanis]|uniref:CBS domain-containing protein n=1 Tax=Veronia nyctiphanis TaxID=1278244 RepID=A0A4Q0Z0H6_9GAMM|nr:CBS domain-containing protein [Veronia nyctiphanis]RXJ74911.1 hypothetical protein CS022_01595 [Veronia nyctiphanis]
MESIKVEDYMNKRPVTFTPEMPLSEAMDKILKTHQSGAPVIDDRHQIVGFLSELDMIQQLLKVGYSCQDSKTVGDCMYKEVLSVSPYDNIMRLAEQMVPTKPKVYPVCDSGRLVGLITRRDILRAISTQIGDGFLHPV